MVRKKLENNERRKKNIVKIHFVGKFITEAFFVAFVI